jgi:hypothetical protein
MQQFYEWDRQANAIALFIAAARALKSRQVQQARAGYRRTADFRLSVYDPDVAQPKKYVGD